MKEKSTKYPYILERSDRKTLSMRVTNELTLLVRAPKHIPVKEIDRFVSAHQDWVEKQRIKIQKLLQDAPPLTQQEITLLKQKAKAQIPPLVELYAQRMGLYPANVKITSAKKRFGSCNAKRNICFSCLLMRYPQEAIDYVIVHELAHLKHMNHSAAFYALVGSVLPDYKERRKLLKG